MLAPRDRMTIYDIVRPPSGCAFDALAACTYSAALGTLLSLPVAILADVAGALPGSGRFSQLQLAALKRAGQRTLVFCQRGAIHGAERLPPTVIEAESLLHEVTAPGGGAFHPKVWLVRFLTEDGEPRLRLAVTSRNLTGDGSWDAGLVMDSKGGRGSGDTAVGDLLRALPARCARPLTPAQSRLLRDLADGADRAAWRTPPGSSRLALHLIGMGETWAPPPSDRLIVASPFLHTAALDALAAASKRPLMLVSRPDALDRTWGAAVAHYERRCVLAAPALEDAAPPGELHAKIYAWDRGRRSGVAVGSMNATNPALNGSNVEFMAELDCTARLGGAGVGALVDRGEFAAMLEEYAPPAGQEVSDEPPDDRAARRALWGCDLFLSCEASDDGWRVALDAERPLPAALAGQFPKLSFWPATLARAEAAHCLAALLGGRPAAFPRPLTLSEITGFVTFEADAIGGERSYFTLKLEVRGVSDEARREAALRTLVPDTGSFVDFVRVLLGDAAPLEAETGAGEGWGPAAGAAGGPVSGLLELLIRCVADDAARLDAVKETLESFSGAERASVVPREFLSVWEGLLPLAKRKR